MFLIIIRYKNAQNHILIRLHQLLYVELYILFVLDMAQRKKQKAKQKEWICCRKAGIKGERKEVVLWGLCGTPVPIFSIAIFSGHIIGRTKGKNKANITY